MSKPNTFKNSYSHEIGPIRPPNEGRDSSLLLRLTRNCPWNRCEFCPTYKGQRFEARRNDQVMADIDTIHSVVHGLSDLSLNSGHDGSITDSLIAEFIRSHPELYDKNDPATLEKRLQSLMNIAGWLSSGATTVFLQDADSLINRTSEVVEILNYLRIAFSSIKRITTYARARTISKKAFEDLVALHEAGLSRIHIGLESGCDDVLKLVQKGVSAAEHVEAGVKVTSAGIELSEYVMPGLGGRRWSENHVRETAMVLNLIQPEFIRLRSLIVRDGTPLKEKQRNGEFIPLTDDELVSEVRTVVELLNFPCKLSSDHMSNLLYEVDGQLPFDKERILNLIDVYRNIPENDRLAFQLKRRLRSYLNIYGNVRPELEETIKFAKEALDCELPDSRLIVDNVLQRLREGFI